MADVEADASDAIETAKDGDAALIAAGGYKLYRRMLIELDLLTANQEMAAKQRVLKLHARN